MKRMMVLLTATTLCLGCVGSALESKREEPEVFRLTAPETADGGDALPGALAVGRPRAPVSLDTERIAVTGPETRFDYYLGVRWAEPAPLMLQHLLVQALTADGRFATVVAVPSRVPSEYQLEIELRRFEAQSDGQGPPVVRVAMQVTLLDAKRGTRLASFPATASVTAEADRRAAVMAAFDAATREVVGSIVAATRNAAGVTRTSSG
jgi:cholesterol transport system auxiliary component